ncbi:MAG: hypothetical protein ACJAVU_003292 [Cognaticolwellia sp.]|jgi:hypothetical protein|tara:strand:- start:5825 stop:6400 length:576 start_codon:yes stop_codon:yes gene_type:complete
MYQICRNLHLAFGLIITPFLVIYAFSALIFSFHIFDNKSLKTDTTTFELSFLPNKPVDLYALLLENHGIRGQLKKSVISKNGNVELLISRPGSYYQILVERKTLLLTIKENTQSVESFIKGLHASTGLNNSDDAQNWWGLSVIFVAVMLIGLVISGVILWSYNRRDRGAGLVFLSCSFFYCITILLVLRFG